MKDGSIYIQIQIGVLSPYIPNIKYIFWDSWDNIFWVIFSL